MFIYDDRVFTPKFCNFIEFHVYILFSLLADNQTAMQEVWSIGDQFLKEIYNTYMSMYREACKENNNKLFYIHNHYDISGKL